MRRRLPPGFLRFAAAVLLIAAVAISDAYLYLAHGPGATYTLRIYRLSALLPIIPANLGVLAAWFALRSKTADDWKVVILLLGVLLGHLLWPVTITVYLR